MSGFWTCQNYQKPAKQGSEPVGFLQTNLTSPCHSDVLRSVLKSPSSQKTSFSASDKGEDVNSSKYRENMCTSGKEFPTSTYCQVLHVNRRYMVLEPVQIALVIYTHVHRECDIVKLSGAFSWLDSGGSKGG